MKYLSRITGLPIVSFESGEQFAKVEDSIFDQENNQLLGFLTDTGGIFSTAEVIRFQDVKSIGEDALIVPTKNVKISADMDEKISEAIKKDTTALGKTVMTEDGKDLGKISDLEIDEETGKVTGYQTSGGIFTDMYKGKTVVPAPLALRVGENVVFVPNSTVEVMEKQIGGLKAAGQTMADVEPSADMVALMESKLRSDMRFQLVHESFADFNYEAGSAQMVISRYVLHDFPSLLPDWYEKIAELLSPGGCFLNLDASKAPTKARANAVLHTLSSLVSSLARPNQGEAASILIKHLQDEVAGYLTIDTHYVLLCQAGFSPWLIEENDHSYLLKARKPGLPPPT